MANIASIVTTTVGVVEAALSNDNIKGTILGKYSDGTPRSLPDAIKGEIVSPEDKDISKKRKKKKKKQRPTSLKL